MAMVTHRVVVAQAECPPSDKGVRCKHRTHGRRYLTLAIDHQLETSPSVLGGGGGGGRLSTSNREDILSF
jgi:hypothetical protein